MAEFTEEFPKQVREPEMETEGLMAQLEGSVVIRELTIMLQYFDKDMSKLKMKIEKDTIFIRKLDKWISSTELKELEGIHPEEYALQMWWSQTLAIYVSGKDLWDKEFSVWDRAFADAKKATNNVEISYDNLKETEINKPNKSKYVSELKSNHTALKYSIHKLYMEIRSVILGLLNSLASVIRVTERLKMMKENLNIEDSGENQTKEVTPETNDHSKDINFAVLESIRIISDLIETLHSFFKDFHKLESLVSSCTTLTIKLDIVVLSLTLTMGNTQNTNFLEHTVNVTMTYARKSALKKMSKNLLAEEKKVTTKISLDELREITERIPLTEALKTHIENSPLKKISKDSSEK